jgi:hypothetical protein
MIVVAEMMEEARAGVGVETEATFYPIDDFFM